MFPFHPNNYNANFVYFACSGIRTQYILNRCTLTSKLLLSQSLEGKEKCEKDALMVFPREAVTSQLQSRLPGIGSGKPGLSKTPENEVRLTMVHPVTISKIS